MSINKLISIKNPILDAMDFLNIDHDKLIPKFTRYATLAEKEIGSWAQYERARKVLDITNCCAHLPNDAVYVELGVLGDLGEGCADLMNRICSTLNATTNYGTVGNTFFVMDVANTETGEVSGSIPFQLQNNKMVFEQNHDGKKVTIQYLKYKTDCDGFLEVGENHVNAIRWYIIWQYLFSKTSLTGFDYGKMNKAEQEWHRECAHARAMDAELSPSDRERMVYQHNNPMKGFGLSLGMNTTLGGYYSIW